MSLHSSRTRLIASLKDLHTRWDRVRNRWDDPVAAEFDRTYLEPLNAKLKAAVGAMEEMDEVVRRVRRECE